MAASWPGHRLALGLGLGVIAAWIIAMTLVLRAAALPREAPGPFLALFAPATPAEDIFARIVAAGGAPVRRTGLPFVWVVAGDAPGLAGRLADAGAWGAFTDLPFAPMIAGCVASAGGAYEGRRRLGSTRSPRLLTY